MSDQEMHLPHGSIWPAWLALAITLVGLALVFAGRAITGGGGQAVNLESFGAGQAFLIAVALVMLVFALGGWIREDMRWWRTNTGTGLGMPRAGTLLFISSEIFIFGALFATYLTFMRIAQEWPDTHEPASHFLPFGNAVIFTLVLFSSSFTVHRAEKHLLKGDHKSFRMWWLATIILGAVFLGGQVTEYVNLVREGMTLGSSHFMTSFFMITGTHGLHVFGGLMALCIVYLRASRGQFDEHRHAFPQSVSMYWHFVDLVWVFVFTVLYILPIFVHTGGHV